MIKLKITTDRNDDRSTPDNVRDCSQLRLATYDTIEF